MTKLLSDISNLTVYWELPHSRFKQFKDEEIDTLIGANTWYTEVMSLARVSTDPIRIWFKSPEDMAIVKVALAHLDRPDPVPEDRAGDILAKIRARTLSGPAKPVFGHVIKN